ncbi:uncharacterized protein LOC124541508 [Vanessa cardui]|uniref:uncharacterized protein LOC124541508 n=1 Tax=Vanessa cardui TaxID=171605 RepID=UPI001F12E848|nr:uncharacterized protein LOC124541508 [Vanessa cardui]
MESKDGNQVRLHVCVSRDPLYLRMFMYMECKLRLKLIRFQLHNAPSAGVLAILEKFILEIKQVCVKFTKDHENSETTGRKRITTDREDRKLVRESLKNRKKASSELAVELSTEVNKTISARTTRRRLQEAGLKGCKARKKPWLSDNNKRARYAWALKYQYFTKEDWSNIIWSDESNFEVFGTYVRRRVGEEFNPQCVVPTVKHGGGSVMVWGCMTDSGVGEMSVCEGRMDSTKSSRESYGDDAIGCCTITPGQCKMCPEHKVRNKSYNVTMIVNETDGEIINCKCHDCVNSAGGCKHAVAFLMRAHRRSEEPPCTSVECSWKKPILSRVGTSLKYITVTQLCKKEVPDRSSSRVVYDDFISKAEKKKVDTYWFSFLCQQPNRASKIIALVPNEHAPSDASEISDSETELHDERTNSSTPLSSPAPSIASSLANLTIDSTDNEESNVDVADIIPDSIVREITESNYENVPSLSAIPSLPSTPIAPLASSLSVSSRKTRSKKPPTVSAKRIKKAKKFQLTYNWRLAQFRHQVTIEADENENYNDLPADDSALSFFYLFFSFKYFEQYCRTNELVFRSRNRQVNSAIRGRI